MAHLTCGECGRQSTGRAPGWRAYLVDLDEDGFDEVVAFCPQCAAREFDHNAERRTTDA